jgi:hypothetical protein
MGHQMGGGSKSGASLLSASSLTACATTVSGSDSPERPLPWRAP